MFSLKSAKKKKNIQLWHKKYTFFEEEWVYGLNWIHPLKLKKKPRAHYPYKHFDVIYQRRRKTVFDHIPKHLEESMTYDAQWSIFDQLRSKVFDIPSQSKLGVSRLRSATFKQRLVFGATFCGSNNLQHLSSTKESRFHRKLQFM